MALRTTMTYIVADVRKMIEDNGATPMFDDDTIQDVLDEECRTDVSYERLEPRSTLIPGGVEYHQYYSEYNTWEDGATLQNGSWEGITADTFEARRGVWNFTAHQPEPVFATGSFYDKNKAAAILLRRWAAKEKLSFDVETNEQQFLRSQKYKMLITLANQYASKVKAKSIPIKRG